MSSIESEMLNGSTMQDISQSEIASAENLSLPEEPTAQNLKQWEQGLKNREAELEAYAQKIKEEKDALTDKQMLLEKERCELDDKLREIQLRESFINEQQQEISNQKQSIHEREMELRAAEQESDRKAADARRDLEKELFETKSSVYAKIDLERKRKTEELERDIERIRSEAEAGIAQREREARDLIDKLYRDAEKQRERSYDDLKQDMERLRQDVSNECVQMWENAKKEIDDQRSALQKEADEQNSSIQAQRAELETREQLLEKEREKVDRNSARTLREQKRQEKKEDDLDAREDELDEEVRRKSDDLIKNYESQLASKDMAIGQLRDQNARLMSDQIAVENFKAIYGDSPKLIEAELARLNTENKKLEDRLAESPNKAVQTERDLLRNECERMRTENEGLLKKVTELSVSQSGMDRVSAENARLTDQIQDLEYRFQNLQGYYETAQNEIRRLSTAQSRLAEREERMKVIQSGGAEPLIGRNIDAKDAEGTRIFKITECEWLDNIWNNCKDFGMVFPRRILYAFHTALKISDWSMITVLSGVSGTGKSELPKLYAAFGGMNFISVPVQPSWDSQESMLGFFNSIDNRFEPEPLLRFLFQCTENPNFSNYMSIVLLDEMNLAHVEHYFADFLSKLEMRRSADKMTLPKVEVKLGAGVEPYYLELRRSILWTGTMNQDETTKSLSDKVLDRGLVIHFPRPEHLAGRKQMISLNAAVNKSGRTLMTTSAWSEWIVRKLDESDNGIASAARMQMDHYRELIEKINCELEGTGRALGHRVWQAIEYYIFNYPTVRQAMQDSKNELTRELREAMDTAFEDQLVQKVMPKLRGIETRGEGRQHLQNIEDFLEQEGFDRLKDDFDLAMELGYGQFIWSSAKYIQTDEESNRETAPDKMSGESDGNS